MKRIFVLLVLVFYMVGCGDKVDEKGFYIEGSKIGINKETGTEFDTSGFDKTGYNEYGFDKEGYNRKGFDKYHYDKDGYNEYGFNRERAHKITGTAFDEKGFDIDGFDREGYGKTGYDKLHFDREGVDVWGYDKEGYHRDGYNKQGYDRSGYDRDGYDRNNFDKKGVNKYTKKKYNTYGFDHKGIHEKTKEKYNERGDDINGKNIKDTLDTAFFVGNFVDEFGDRTGERFIGYNGEVQEMDDGFVRPKGIVMTISKTHIVLKISPYVFLNSSSSVSCSFKIDGKVYKDYFYAEDNKVFISKKSDAEEYKKIIKLFKNGKNAEFVVYNYNHTTYYKGSFSLKGFKELAEFVKIN